MTHVRTRGEETAALVCGTIVSLVTGVLFLRSPSGRRFERVVSENVTALDISV